MSEENIWSLYKKLPEKKIAMAKALGEKAEPKVLVKLDMEIVAIQREISKELQALEHKYSAPVRR